MSSFASLHPSKNVYITVLNSITCWFTNSKLQFMLSLKVVELKPATPGEVFKLNSNLLRLSLSNDPVQSINGS